MASSGWQGQKNIQTSKYPHMALNLYISSINHSGTTLTYSGYVQVVCTSGYIDYNGATVSLTGGGSKSINLHLNSGGTKTANTGTFSCTVSNVAATTTSHAVTASLVAGGVASGSASWTLTFGSGGSAPSGGYINYVSSTWNSVKATIGLSSWGGITGELRGVVCLGSANGQASSVNTSNWETYGRRDYRQVSSATSLTFTATTGNTVGVDNPIEIKGLTHYKLAYWARNSIGTTKNLGDNNTLRYLPPAPSALSYVDQGGVTDKTFTLTFAGSAANNQTTYDSASLTRTVRYKIGSGEWHYIDAGTVAAVDFVTTANITVPAGQIAIVEGWQTYHGQQSEISSITIRNTNAPVRFYASKNGAAKQVIKFYSPWNGTAKKTIKIYASEGGVAKKVYEDV